MYLIMQYIIVNKMLIPLNNVNIYSYIFIIVVVRNKDQCVEYIVVDR